MSLFVQEGSPLWILREVCAQRRRQGTERLQVELWYSRKSEGPLGGRHICSHHGVHRGLSQQTAEVQIRTRTWQAAIPSKRVSFGDRLPQYPQRR
eukprot:g18405.t1